MTRDEYAGRAQRMLWPLVSSLQEAEDTLDAIISAAPGEIDTVPDTPADFLLEIEGALYFVLNDYLHPMLDVLRRLAAVTSADVCRHQEAARLQLVN